MCSTRGARPWRRWKSSSQSRTVGEIVSHGSNGVTPIGGVRVACLSPASRSLNQRRFEGVDDLLLVFVRHAGEDRQSDRRVLGLGRAREIAGSQAVLLHVVAQAVNGMRTGTRLNAGCRQVLHHAIAPLAPAAHEANDER